MSMESLAADIEKAWAEMLELPAGDELALYLYRGVATENGCMVPRWKLLREFRVGARRIEGDWTRSTNLPALRAAVFNTLQGMSRL
jgi:hypothetical protein